MHIFESLATRLESQAWRVAYISKIQQNTFFVSLTLLPRIAVLQVSKIVHQRASERRRSSKKICISKRKFSFASNIKKMCIFLEKQPWKLVLSWQFLSFSFMISFLVLAYWSFSYNLIHFNTLWCISIFEFWMRHFFKAVKAFRRGYDVTKEPF